MPRLTQRELVSLLRSQIEGAEAPADGPHTIKHRGFGRFDVLGADGVVIQGGLAKPDAQDLRDMLNAQTS